MTTQNMHAERIRGMMFAFKKEFSAPFTKEEEIEHAGIIARASAAMGRSLVPTLEDVARSLNLMEAKIDDLQDEIKVRDNTIEAAADARKELLAKVDYLTAELAKSVECRDLQVERNVLLQKEVDAANDKTEEVRKLHVKTQETLALGRTQYGELKEDLEKWQRIAKESKARADVAEKYVQENANDCNELTSAILKLGTKHSLMEESMGWGDTLDRLDSKIESLEHIRDVERERATIDEASTEAIDSHLRRVADAHEISIISLNTTQVIAQIDLRLEQSSLQNKEAT